MINKKRGFAMQKIALILSLLVLGVACWFLYYVNGLEYLGEEKGVYINVDSSGFEIWQLLDGDKIQVDCN